MTQAGQLRAFPRISGETLSRRPMSLPGDLEGEINLVFVAFQRQHQDDVDHWLRELGDIEVTFDGLALYEVPLLMRFPRFYRQWIDNGMRAGIPDPKTRSRTITVYTNRRHFLNAVGLQDESDIFATLLDEEGRMVWTHVGPPTDEALGELTAVITRLRS